MLDKINKSVGIMEYSSKKKRMATLINAQTHLLLLCRPFASRMERKREFSRCLSFSRLGFAVLRKLKGKKVEDAIYMGVLV